MSAIATPTMSPVEEALLAEARKLTDLPIVRVRAYEDEDHMGSPIYRVAFGIDNDYRPKQKQPEILGEALLKLKEKVNLNLPPAVNYSVVVLSYEKNLPN